MTPDGEPLSQGDGKMRKTLTVVATGALAVVPALSAEAAPRQCDGLILKSVEMVLDQGQVGVLDAGDVFTITFKRPILGMNGPSSELRFLGANGEAGMLSHPNADFEFTETVKSVTVSIQQSDIVGAPVEIALPLPVTVTTVSGVSDKKGNDLDAHVSTECSKDVTLE